MIGKGFELAFGAFSRFLEFNFILFFENGGDWFRRDMKHDGPHAEDVSPLLNHLANQYMPITAIWLPLN